MAEDIGERLRVESGGRAREMSIGSRVHISVDGLKV